jgi:single stranded DNA-binding protein
MAGSVNKVILIGNLGKDPEIRFLENGTCLARFSIATSETYLDKTSGEKREVTEWHSIVAWKGLATIVQTYLRKGMKVYVEGKLRTELGKTNQIRQIRSLKLLRTKSPCFRSLKIKTPPKSLIQVRLKQLVYKKWM